MKTVYKYQLAITDYQQVIMPEGAVILTVMLQIGVPCIWAMVESSHEITERTIRIAGTGHQLENNAVYIGTFLIENDLLVFHVFDITK